MKKRTSILKKSKQKRITRRKSKRFGITSSKKSSKKSPKKFNDECEKIYDMLKKADYNNDYVLYGELENEYNDCLYKNMTQEEKIVAARNKGIVYGLLGAGALGLGIYGYNKIKNV